MRQWPFLQPVHGYPSQFFNATREGLAQIFQDKGFEVTETFTGAHQSAAYTVNWIMSVLLHRLPPAERKRLGKMKLEDLAAMDPRGPMWTSLVNALPPAAQSELACGNFLVGRKPIAA